jgi:hypothetical protein
MAKQEAGEIMIISTKKGIRINIMAAELFSYLQIRPPFYLAYVLSIRGGLVREGAKLGCGVVGTR